MAEFLTPKERSHRMSLIKSKDTKCELKMAQMLALAGLRFKKHVDLPGTPDFLVGKRLALFVNGDFWHGRTFWKNRDKYAPFWFNKILGNMKRDRRVDRALRLMGFTVIRVWETDLRAPDGCMRRVRKAIHASSKSR